jgi:hypothetical protein
MNPPNNKLKMALETVLKLAEAKLQYAIDRNKEWDIEHYQNDVDYIKSEINLVKK